MVKPMELAADPQTLKKALHEKIERMEAGHLSLLNRVILQLDAEELAHELDESFDGDRREGKLTSERIQQVIAKVRAEHPYG